MKEQAVTFEDVLILPKFSKVGSRKNVDLATNMGNGLALSLPVISANMETITGPEMATTMWKNGGLGILHRFMSVENNIKAFNESKAVETAVSIGIGDKEKERAEALITAGAWIVCIDVAHGAQIEVVEQVKWLRKNYRDNLYIIAGNFATPSSIEAFELECFSSSNLPNIYKVGIGPGSACTTRIKTGVGVPQLSAILSCAKQFPVLADGGMKTPGDIAKAIGAGAKAVMLGGMLAGTTETPGENIYNDPKLVTKNKFKSLIVDSGTRPGEYLGDTIHHWSGIYTYNSSQAGKVFKIFKGSASGNYGSGWKTSEGEEYKVPYKGSVVPILKDIEGGLRSALTYTNSKDLNEFRQNCEFILVSNSTRIENGPHGKN